MDKLSEAKKYLKEGDEALKTGVFKWSKDYASAAINYDEAAKIYKSAKQYDQAQAVYEKLVLVNEKMNDPWAVARNYETMVTINLDRNDGSQIPASRLIEWTAKAGTYFRLANSPNSYVTLVKKVAKFLDERSDLVEALNLYKNLLNDLQDDEQHHLHTEIVSAYASVLMKIQRYPECVDLFEREYTFKKGIVTKSGSRQNLDTLALTLTSLNLVMGDIDRAEKRLQEFALDIKDFIRTPEFDVSDKMIEAYNDGNQAAFDKIAQRGVLNSVFPLNILKELRKVKVKANVAKKKVMDIMDLNNDYQAPVIKSNDYQAPAIQNTGNLGNFGNLFPEEQTEANNNVSQPAVTEEQRQKALDDMLC